MHIQEQINQQRVKHIVSSYGLADGDPFRFGALLDELLQIYPAPLIELALIETLVDRWSQIPMVKGFDFLQQAHTCLKTWESQPIVSTIAPEQFQQITGLDPSPIFGPSELPPACPVVQP